MGKNRPVNINDWIDFLKYNDCEYLRKKGSHVHYKCPGCFRTITFRGNSKDIPALHLQTNLRSMGKSLSDLYTWIENKKKLKKTKNK